MLSTAVAKEIHKNISGLRSFGPAKNFAQEILENGSYKGLAKTRYVNDKQITDHYAIIPTGQGFQALGGLKGNSFGVYAAIVRRFLSIFYHAAVFQKINLVTMMEGEKFFSNFKVLLEEGYYKVSGVPGDKRGMAQSGSPVSSKENGGLETQSRETSLEEEEIGCDTVFLEALNHLRKGSAIPVQRLSIKEGETSPPKRYNSGSMILAMENAGHGKCGSTDRGRRTAGTDQGQRYRHQRHPGGDPEKAGGKQIHCPE